MTLRSWLRIAALMIAVVAGVSVYYAWRAGQREQEQLKAELQATKKALADADARQEKRNAELTETLAQFNQKKVAIETPVQVVKALPDVLPLPMPLIFSEPTSTASNSGTADRGGTTTPDDKASLKVLLPTEDLKPLYDFAVDCQECKAQLTAAQANLKDEQAKTRALTTERDSALKVARGGSTLRRVVRAAKWFVIGAAAGALAGKLAR